MVIPQHLFGAIDKIQDTILICPPVISQYAAIGALKAGKQYCQQHLETLENIRRIVLNRLEELGDICTFSLGRERFTFF